MVKKLNDALFGPQSPASLGLFRIVVCTLAFLALIILGLNFSPWFSEFGLWPKEHLLRWGGSYPRLSLLAAADQDWMAWAVWLGAVLGALLGALGLWTRASLILLFVCLVSLHHRSPDLLNSGDTLLRQWVFLLMISPCGAALGLDSVRAKRRGSQESQISSWPLRLAQIQLAVMYLTTVMLKWEGEMWRDGTAISIVAQHSEYMRFPMPSFLTQPPLLQAFTYGTLVIEIALGTLVFWRPARGWVLLGGVVLHGSIDTFFNIPFFAWICFAGYLCHYRGEELEGFWDRMKSRLPGGSRLASPAAEIGPGSP